MRFRFFALLWAALSLGAQPNLYVSTNPASIHVVNTGLRTVPTTIQLDGTAVTEVPTALSPDLSRLYAVLWNGNSVRSYNTATNALSTTYATGASPRYIAVGLNGSFLYVVRAQGAVDRIAVSGGAVNQNHYLPGVQTEPAAALVNRSGTRLYIAERGGTGQIRVLSIDAAGNLGFVGTIPLQGKPRSLAVSLDDQRLYAAGEGISVIDTAANSVLTRVGAGTEYHTIRVADAVRALVTSESATGLSLLELIGNTLEPIPEIGSSRGLAISPDATTAWVANATSPQVREVDLLTQMMTPIALPGQALPTNLLLGGGPRPALGCIAEVQPRTVAFTSAASSYPIIVTQPSDCAWTATAGASWLHITSGSSGTGNGVVTFSADANTALASRTASLTIGGQRVIVTQSGKACTYSISPGSRTAPATSQTGQIFGDIDVSAPAGCEWTASSDVSWIHISEGTGSGSGNSPMGVQYTVDPNTSSTRRVGTVTVARQTFTVTQLGSGPAIECLAVGEAATIRSEGLAERVGDIVVYCSSTAAGDTVVTGDVFVQFNVPITNDINSSGLTDAVLLVGDPTPDQLQKDSNAVLGVLAGPNSLRFTGQLTVGPNGVIVRIANVRVNASLVPGGYGFGVVFARVNVRTTSTVPLAMSFDDTVPAIAMPGSRAFVGNFSSVSGTAMMLPVSFAEQFPTAYKPRISGCNSPESDPGVECHTESGFMNEAKLGSATGRADFGTRLRVRVPVPAGVKVYAPINNAGGNQAPLAITDEKGQGQTGWQTGTSMFGGTYRELSVSGGFATAVWEALRTDPELKETLVFNLVIENATEAQRTEMRKALLASLAPVSTVMRPDVSRNVAPIPRFLDPLGAPKFVNLRVVTRAVRVGTLTDSMKTGFRSSIGSSYVFNYDVYNDSSETATGVVVRGSLPAQFTYTGCSVPGGTCMLSGSDVSATIPQIEGGGSASVNIQAQQTANVPAGSLLESRVNVTSNEADADLPSNEASSGILLEECPPNTLTPVSASFTAAGGQGQFNIGSACSSWTVRASADWVTIDTAKAGTGAFTTRYTVAPNLSSSARSTTIVAAGQTFTISQSGAAPACPLTINSTGQTTSPANGRFGQLGVTAGNCGWTARSSDPWLELYPLSGTGNGTVSMTVYPNFGTQQRTATVTIGAEVVAITQSGMTGSADLRFVRRAYFNALRRLPSAAEEQFHFARLTSGVSRSDVMRSFLEGGEFKAGGAFVTGLYRVLLGRVPERGGWAFQLNSVVALGTPQVTLAGVFMESAEWKLKQGGTITDAAFITLLYREVLGRTPSQAEIDWQVGNVRASSRARIATNFLSGAEFFVNKGPLLNALHAYFVILGRGPTTTELTNLENQLKAGTPFATIIASFVNSAEHNNELQ